MIEVTSTVKIEESEIQYDFIRASGPGGQNVNKVSTSVQLRFDVVGSPSLPPEVKERLLRLAGRRITADGILVIEAREFRTQEGNRLAAIDRLVALIRQAAERPKIRRQTKPTLASQRRRMERKRRRSATKSLRRTSPEME